QSPTSYFRITLKMFHVKHFQPDSASLAEAKARIDFAKISSDVQRAGQSLQVKHRHAREISNPGVNDSLAMPGLEPGIQTQLVRVCRTLAPGWPGQARP
ncbi:MAG: hypothetical protein ACRD72_26280, partial [Candidatus Angelobacter sp.]